MREIYFRIWTGRAFHYWGFLRGESGLYFKGIENTPESMSYKLTHSQQYTGLVDREGQMIYEGDIIISMYTGNHPAIVECDAPDGGYNIREGDGNYVEIDSNTVMEVIGNIYENPELLEEK